MVPLNRPKGRKFCHSEFFTSDNERERNGGITTKWTSFTIKRCRLLPLSRIQSCFRRPIRSEWSEIPIRRLNCEDQIWGSRSRIKMDQFCEDHPESLTYTRGPIIISSCRSRLTKAYF